ncbi:UNKNOWN [Stylonychia lemnae]|uniref:Uncharacterized protein n=1 Tax=Stylonychia lemnae TaxID=5949 RepID=A0A078AIU5_STYLE|nr:UNKNOWN [Stylonychia lemnae]|eukprot:CDW82225.1 UNKNOWN [Stylonychia lemnae]
MTERDIFKKCLDILQNKSKQDELLDYGEKESILDGIKSNLQFCIQYEDQLKQLGIEVPKNKVSRNNPSRQSQINTFHDSIGNSMVQASHNTGSLVNNITTSENTYDRNSMYSLKSLMENFRKLVKQCVEVFPIDTLPEDFMAAPKKEMESWKLDKVRIVLRNFNEPLLNLHFFNPYLKSNATLFTYRYILTIFDYMTEEENNRFISKVIEYLAEYKIKLFEQMEDEIELCQKILPMFHILKYAFSHLQFTDKDKMKALAQECHELTMMPLPYGIIPHELIEIIDKERIIPGITKIMNLAKDFPYVDHHSINKEKDDIDIFHQRAYIFSDNKQEQTNPMLKYISYFSSVKEQLLKFNHLHDMRYTFVIELFGSYNLLGKSSTSAVSLEEHLSGLLTSNVWNVYKQLQQDIMEKSNELPYNEFDRTFRKLVMEPLADYVLNKTMIKKGLVNKKLKHYPKFKLIFGSQSPESTQSIAQFISKQQEDKGFMPPIRLVVVGNDESFHSFVQSLIKEYISKNSNFYKHDVRVFLIPFKVNTLAHYIAMHDDLYCNNIYLAQTQNPFITATLKKNMSIDQYLQSMSQQFSLDEQTKLMNLNDQILQDFLRDATRTFNVKVFVCEFFRDKQAEKPYKSVYFTNRFEYGHSSVYTKLKAINDVLQASNQAQLIEAESKLEQLLKENENNPIFQHFDQSVRVELQVKRMDYTGKEYSSDVQIEPLDCNVAYLKLINTPTMFDIGCVQADPSTDFLTLNMVDDKTFKIENQDFLNTNQKLKKSKIKKFRGAIQAIHTNLFVSEVTIIPQYVVKEQIKGDQKPTQQTSVKREERKSSQGRPNSNKENARISGMLNDNSLKLENIPLVIDGQKYEESAKKFIIKRYKKDNIHVSIPLATFLPLRIDDIFNQFV